ncbi:MAG: hypothetical protein LBQ81_07325 [Zoogloeaceae bacterium]|jgi:hypothetical protein|nr:hypothetical protein [Zoogloeaceae bacterium]
MSACWPLYFIGGVPTPPDLRFNTLKLTGASCPEWEDEQPPDEPDAPDALKPYVQSRFGIGFARGISVGTGNGIGHAIPTTSARLHRYQNAVLAAKGILIPDENTAHLETPLAIKREDGAPVMAAVGIASDWALIRRAAFSAMHQDAKRIAPPLLALPVDDGLRITIWKTHHYQAALCVSRIVAVAEGAAVASGAWIRLRHEDGRVPRIGISRARPPEPPHVSRCWPLYFVDSSGILPDLCFSTAKLTGEPPCAPWTPINPEKPPRPNTGALILNNEFALYRHSDGLPLQALSFSLTADAGNFTYGWSATLPAAAMPLLMNATEPMLLDAVICGQHFTLLVEDFQRQTAFNQARLSIGSRGQAAKLADPFIPKISMGNGDGGMTARQLAIAAIDNPFTIDNGAAGWDIDWQLAEDWFVPQGAWNFAGTPIEAVAKIASAGGGVVQPHPTEKRLIIAPRYPILPWHWNAATPDLELPLDYCLSESIAWTKTPEYNAVHVMGSNQFGIVGEVTRQGTAGDLAAESFTDDLITDVYAARMKGEEILSDVGSRRDMQWSLPVMPETGGVILPGTFLMLTDSDGHETFGIVRHVNVTVNFPVIRQTITVETR